MARRHAPTAPHRGLFCRRQPERTILELARASRLHLCTSPPLLAELQGVLAREKFRPYPLSAKTNAYDVTLGYAALATVFQTPTIAPVVAADPDDAVLACTEASKSAYIASGDRHLLALGRYDGVPIVNARAFVEAEL
ncbi:PilT domain-containing protein [Truepera radiovictrix DSM 17093]|uniref:PilT domain-containing protein n=1 Tax=Truepera radiovictrix (strain DSM 17093 / CIP 108686 / LMG 22925 / RQ-24) TaxID=649638 RepID=D7CUH3_TRURR|nr:PilT domain-containing protein [Truepera radiovictrix DSM 17093]